MSSIYLIRHGQAGLRHSYDSLSDLGRRQARLLGEYLARQNIRFSAIYSGELKRQRETAREVVRMLEEAGVLSPRIETDARWNEFDLDGVYQAIAPQLAAEDSEFRAEHDELKRLLTDENSSLHRSWTKCDTAVVRAWVEARYEVPGESWIAFQERICGCLEMLSRVPSGEAVAVFTSATPMAVWTGMALGLSGRHMLRLAGVTYNTALTTMRLREDGELMLFSFNGTPHLLAPELRTFR